MNKTFALPLVASCLLLSSSADSASLPSSHLLPGVVWHQQMNGLFCGPASLDIVFDYWGPEHDQKAIADVARSSSIGTWCYDIQRAGHFSVLSAAQGSYFPNEVPTAGFPERPLGLASFAHAAESIWLDDLKALLAADIPVVMLMQFAPDGTGGGHYRVAIGYDETQGVIYFSDPWGRDMRYLPDMPGVIAWSYSEVEAAWNYVAYGTPLPFWGAAIMPWNVEVSTKGKVKPGSTITVTALVNYPCPQPFDSTQFPASTASATIVLPTGMTLLGAPSVSIGNMAAGTTQSVTWQVRVDQVPTAGTVITVQAQGVFQAPCPKPTGKARANRTRPTATPT